MGDIKDVRDTRFKPGQSGNTRGRPRKVKPDGPQISDLPMLQAALAVARRPIAISDGGQRKEVSVGEALLRALVAAGVKNSPYAANKAIEYITAAQMREAQELERERQLWTSYKEACGVLDAAARLEGRSPEQHFPHPDDVIVDACGPVRFIGPVDEEGQRKMEETIRFRNLFILQDGYDTRFGPCNEKGEPYKSSAGLFAHMLERSIPSRFRLTEVQWFMRFDAAARIPKLQLLKMLYRGWRAEGRNYRRGTIFPSLEWGAEATRATIQCANIMREHVSRGTTTDHLFDYPEVAAAFTNLQAIRCAPRY